MKVQQNLQKKQAIVGVLLVYSPTQNIIGKLAVWYRVIGQSSKIVKLQRIKSNDNISYRCNVFDIGADIVLKLQNQDICETKIYGPVKFDSYLSKQLEDNKNLNCIFNICINSKTNLPIPSKIKTTINQQGKLLLHLQPKNQHEIIFKIPFKTQCRNYQQFFDIQDIRLTDVIIKQVQSQKIFKEKLKNVNIIPRSCNSLQITFSNGVQRNLFLAQILKKVKDISQIPRHSQLKSIAASQQKMQNQIQDLFKSNMSSNYFQKSSQISQKVVRQMKNVIFTPSAQNDNIHEIAFSSTNFDNFLNPQNQNIFKKLSQIVQQYPQIQQKSTSNIQKLQKSLDKLSSTKKIQPILSKSNLHYVQQQDQTNWNWNKITQQNKILTKQNKYLTKQNILLKKQNNLLRKKMMNDNYKNKYFKSIVYHIPKQLKNYYKSICQTQRKYKQRAYSHQQKIILLKQKTLVTQETSRIIQKNVINKFFIQSEKASYENLTHQDKIKQSTKTITTSSKTIKQFTGFGSAHLI